MGCFCVADFCVFVLLTSLVAPRTSRRPGRAAHKRERQGSRTYWLLSRNPRGSVPVYMPTTPLAPAGCPSANRTLRFAMRDLQRVLQHSHHASSLSCAGSRDDVRERRCACYAAMISTHRCACYTPLCSTASCLCSPRFALTDTPPSFGDAFLADGRESAGSTSCAQSPGTCRRLFLARQVLAPRKRENEPPSHRVGSMSWHNRIASIDRRWRTLHLCKRPRRQSRTAPHALPSRRPLFRSQQQATCEQAEQQKPTERILTRTDTQKNMHNISCACTSSHPRCVCPTLPRLSQLLPISHRPPHNSNSSSINWAETGSCTPFSKKAEQAPSLKQPRPLSP